MKTSQEMIIEEIELIKEMLLEKNKSYGDSVFDPVNIFSDLSSDEQIKVRIDDKLCRLKRGKEYNNEDTVLDLIGYLIILRVNSKYSKQTKDKDFNALY